MPSDIWQVCTIHARPRENALPCIYALLPIKQQEACYRLFRHVLETAETMGNGPPTIMLNFEKEAIDATRNTFINVDVSGCFFDFLKVVETNAVTWSTRIFVTYAHVGSFNIYATKLCNRSF